MGKKNMNNDSVTSQTAKSEDGTGESSKNWSNSAWLAITSFIFLSGAISSLQNIAERFANDADYALLIANWLSWIAVLFFALGWFMTHWIETTLLKKQFKAAILLFATLFIGSFLISSYFQFFTSNEVLQRLGTVSLFLIFSGYFLRYSTFRNKIVLPLQNLIPRRKS
jgi:cation transport ATPase